MFTIYSQILYPNLLNINVEEEYNASRNKAECLNRQRENRFWGEAEFSAEDHLPLIRQLIS